jgi:hypothetical protein
MIVADSDLVPSGLSRAGRTIGRNLITVPISIPRRQRPRPSSAPARFEKGTVNGPLTAPP